MRRSAHLVARVWVLLALAVVWPPEALSAGLDPTQPGRRLWKTSVDDGATPFAIAVAPDGSRVYVTGSGQLADFLTVALDATSGNILWSSAYDVPGSGNGDPFAIAVSPDGSRVFVTGLDNELGYATVAYEAGTGTQAWDALFPGFEGKGGVPYAIGVSPDSSRVFVTGTSASDFGTIAYDASSGSQMWQARYRGPLPGGSDIAIDLAVGPDGSQVYVTGSSPSGDDIDYATIAYDTASGQPDWFVRYHDRQWPQDTPYALDVSPDGSRVFVTGCRTDLAECFRGDIMTIALDATVGVLRWKAIYDGAALEPDVAYDVAAHPDGDAVFVTGTSQQDGRLVGVTIGYDAETGARDWIEQTSSASGPTFLWRLAVAGDRVVVTGQTGDYQGHRMLTIGYEASTGTRAWRVIGPEGLANGVGIQSDGTVAFVIGNEEPATAWNVFAVRT